jgi:hypothetical protein
MKYRHGKRDQVMSVEYEAWRILYMISVGVLVMPHGVISREKYLIYKLVMKKMNDFTT